MRNSADTRRRGRQRPPGRRHAPYLKERLLGREGLHEDALAGEGLPGQVDQPRANLRSGGVKGGRSEHAGEPR